MDRKLENKKQEELLREFNDNPVLLKQIADASPAIIYLLDLDKTEFVYMNKRVEDAWGYDELYIFTHGKNIFSELCHPEEYERRMSQVASLAAMEDIDSNEGEARINTRHHGYRWFHIREQVFKRDRNGKATVAIGVAYDIHEQKLVQMELQEKKLQLEQQNTELQNFKRTIESSHDAIITLDPDYKIIQWNKAAELLFGYTEKEIKGYSFMEKLVPRDKFKTIVKAFKNVTRGQVVNDLTIQLKSISRHQPDTLLTVFPLKDEKGDITGCCLLARNITAEVKAEKDIRQLNKTLTLKNKELASLANELQSFNSLATTHYMETLKTLYTALEFIVTVDGDHLSNSGRANIRRAQASIQKMKLLTHDIIAYLRLQQFGKLMIIGDFNQVFNKAILDLQSKFRDVDIRIQSDRLPQLKTNTILLGLLFHNLMENAIKFRKGTGPVQIRIKYSLADELNFIPEALQDTTYHIISISDNGIGFEEQYSEKVFQLFTKLEEKKFYGSGVGLAVCKKIMELHGGFIRAESERGLGSTFRCYFPADEE